MRFVSTVLFGLALAVQAHAGDRIGNGGGLWACMSANQTIQNSTLVDFYEAENEFNLSLITSPHVNPMLTVDEVEKSIQQNFPEYSVRWSAILKDVKSRINYVNSELTVVEDALYRVKPLPSLCRAGWVYLQFANYTPQNQVLIRRDLWNSPDVDTLDKAGLIWHEVIYRWMREEFSDKDSVRARQIVGILFSTLSTLEARLAISELLRPGTEPTPQTPVWVCLVKNSMNSRYFLDYGTDEVLAKSRTVETCHAGGDEFHCQEREIRCESFTSMKETTSCTNINNLSGTYFTGSGRSQLEAEAKARRSCTEAKDPFFCDREVICSD